MNNRDIIIIAHQPWDTTGGANIKDLALEFAKNNRVLYVNLPLNRSTALFKRNAPEVKMRTKVLKGEYPELWQESKNIWVLQPQTLLESINWIGIDSVFDFLNKTNSERLARRIKMAMLRLNFQDAILFNDSVMFEGLHLNEYLNTSLNVYYIRDFLISQPYFKRHGIKCEAEIMAKSDLVVANSVYLAEYAAKYNPNSYYVGQGCQPELFNPDKVVKLPEIYGSISTPIIGYAGNLTAMRLDIQLLTTLAITRPEWTFVFVGPQDYHFENSRLHMMSNVIFTGPKPMDELPAYVKGFDVCLNPQLVNDLTIGNYPRKIDEYLAMGKPVVATATKAMEIFDDQCYLANNAMEYIKFIQHALKNDSQKLQDERKELANSHTWENNAQAIYDAMYATCAMADVA